MLRQARRNFEFNQSKGWINAQATPDKTAEPKKEEKRTAPIIATGSNTPAFTGQPQTENTRKTKKYGQYIVWPFVAVWRIFRVVFSFLDKHNGAVTALATIVIAVLTYYYATYSKKQWQITSDTLQISQRAYVTIGRKDGVIADFIVPKDEKQNAEIVIYFQNTGHLPAKFAWGTMVPYLVQTNKPSGITYTHPFTGFPTRTRDKKTGVKGEQGASSTIPGDSVFVSTLGQISLKALAELPTNNVGLLIIGMYAYCDELGNYSSRMFGLRYRSAAASSSLSFDLASDVESSPTFHLPEPTATTEYLFPCKTFNEK